MGRLALFLVLSAFSLTFSDALAIFCDTVTRFADASYCVHLRCEWHGAESYGVNKQGGTALTDHIVSDDDESEASKLAIIQAKYPVNTFNVAEDVDKGTESKGRWLWCNADWMYPAQDYKSFIKLVQNPEWYETPPNLNCRPSVPVLH